MATQALGSESAKILSHNKPRRQAFEVVIERAKTRQEIEADLDPALVFDTTSGIMLYAQIFTPTPESWKAYVRCALHLILRKPLT